MKQERHRGIGAQLRQRTLERPDEMVGLLEMFSWGSVEEARAEGYKSDLEAF